MARGLAPSRAAIRLSQCHVWCREEEQDRVHSYEADRLASYSQGTFLWTITAKIRSAEYCGDAITKCMTSERLTQLTRTKGVRRLEGFFGDHSGWDLTRDEWNHLLCLFSISHFSSTACTAAMAKWAQQGSGEERVTAKSRPMMNLIARMPSVVSSSTSSSPGKIWYEYQDPGKSVVVDLRSGQPDRLPPAGFSKLDDDRAWFFQVEKWGYGTRSIRATWWNFLECGTTSSFSSRRNSSRWRCVIRKGRRDNSWWIRATW